MYIEDLVGSKIVSAEGKHLGHVVDLQFTGGPEYEVSALVFGEPAWLYRYNVLEPFTRTFGISLKPHTVPWASVERFEHFVVTLKPGATPQRMPERVIERQRAASAKALQQDSKTIAH
jgi:sporulation protein YlmC with PRC-barrel domain